MDSDPRRHRDRSRKPGIEGLEDRRLPSSALPDIAMISATTADSKGVTAEYEVRAGAVGQRTQFEVVRSADDRSDPTDVPVGSAQFAAPGQPGETLDASGKPALAPGHHQVTIALPGGLPPDPKHPYVLVVADP